MAVDVRSKACNYLRSGAVTLLDARSQDGVRPWLVHARVVGHSSTYVVTLAEGAWNCTCHRPAECAHVAAVQLVTGHPSLARREIKGGRRAA
ncbi:hypothetical protein ACU635_51050 [[Actinomadura] parvosata]|uniref:hypothetical protein n=1 Tax=[Actinomadura] parvosata TaxID=1955412 RepID=UPI00406C7BE5